MKTTSLLLPAVALAALAGCTTDRYGRVVPPDPIGRALVDAIDPVYEPQEYVVVNDPPPRRRDVRPVAPNADAVWVDGHHDWRGNRWVWVPGRYVSRPRPGANYVPGEYYVRNDQRYWRSGYWR